MPRLPRPTDRRHTDYNEVCAASDRRETRVACAAAETEISGRGYQLRRGEAFLPVPGLEKAPDGDGANIREPWLCSPRQAFDIGGLEMVWRGRVRWAMASRRPHAEVAVSRPPLSQRSEGARSETNRAWLRQ